MHQLKHFSLFFLEVGLNLQILQASALDSIIWTFQVSQGVKMTLPIPKGSRVNVSYRDSQGQAVIDSYRICKNTK